MRRVLVVLAALVVVAGAFAAGALIFRNSGGEGWSEADERKFLDRIIEPGRDVTRYEPGASIPPIGTFPGLSIPPRSYNDFVDGTDPEWAACVLEVYEEYFPSYDDYADSSDDSPTLLKADAAAQRRCD
jgi:hypothetical protein